MDPVYEIRGVRPRARFSQRVLAYVLDLVLLNVVGLLVFRDSRPSVRGLLLGAVITVAYFGFLEGGRTGQTLGKRIAGIRVVDFEAGTSIDPGRAFVRAIVRLVSSFFLLGYLWMLWDRDGQTWHDKVASTTVVPMAEFPVERR